MKRKVKLKLPKPRNKQLNDLLLSKPHVRHKDKRQDIDDKFMKQEERYEQRNNSEDS